MSNHRQHISIKAIIHKRVQRSVARIPYRGGFGCTSLQTEPQVVTGEWSDSQSSHGTDDVLHRGIWSRRTGQLTECRQRRGAGERAAHPAPFSSTGRATGSAAASRHRPAAMSGPIVIQRTCGASQWICGASQRPGGASQRTCGASQRTCGASRRTCGASQRTWGASQQTCGASQRTWGQTCALIPGYLRVVR